MFYFPGFSRKDIEESMQKGHWLGYTLSTTQIGWGGQCVLSTIYITQYYQLGMLWSLMMYGQPAYSWKAVTRTRVILQLRLPILYPVRRTLIIKKYQNGDTVNVRPGRFNYQLLFLEGLLKAWKFHSIIMQYDTIQSHTNVLEQSLA